MAGEKSIGRYALFLSTNSTEMDKGLGKAESRAKQFSSNMMSTFKGALGGNLVAGLVGKFAKGLFDPLEDLAKEWGQRLIKGIASIFAKIPEVSKEARAALEQDLARVKAAFDINTAGLAVIDKMRREARFLETNATPEFREKEAFREQFIVPLQQKGENEAADFLMRRFERVQDKLIDIKRGQEGVNKLIKLAAEFGEQWAKSLEEAKKVQDKLNDNDPIRRLAPADIRGSQASANALALGRFGGNVAEKPANQQGQKEGNDILQAIQNGIKQVVDALGQGPIGLVLGNE